MVPCPCNELNEDESENVAYNNLEFPAYIRAGQLKTYPNYSAVSHWHDDLEFIYILKGKMTYDVNGQKVLLNEGEGIFVNSRCFHYGYSQDHTDCLFYCVLLSPKLITSNEYFLINYLNPLLQNKNFPYQKLVPSHFWENSILEDIQYLYQECKDEIKPYLILEKTIHIFKILFENMNSSLSLNEDDEDIKSLTLMIGYVQKNYANKILLKDISSYGNCCKTKCSELFRKYLNTSPMVYLNQYRLEKSLFLLKNTKMSTTEIAYSCGFSNSSYFCEIFHKYYNTTPGEFRNN